MMVFEAFSRHSNRVLRFFDVPCQFVDLEMYEVRLDI